jgi:hypothetical protein
MRGPKRRSAVTVTFRDGTTETETGYGVGSGYFPMFFPMFGWKRRFPVIQYAVYR